MEDMTTNKEYILWLEERSEKLRQLESMICKVQYETNDKNEPIVFLEKISKEDLYDKLSDAEMEIFRLWYFVTYGKKYDL